jgi:hypothetical protein
MADPQSTIEAAMDAGLDNSDAAFTQYSATNPGAILSWELTQNAVSPDGSVLVAPTTVGIGPLVRQTSAAPATKYSLTTFRLPVVAGSGCR